MIAIRFNKETIIAIIFGPFWKRLQSYIVRFGTEFAIVFGPLCDEACIHIRSLSSTSLQSNLVHTIKIIAIISGPALYGHSFKDRILSKSIVLSLEQNYSNIKSRKVSKLSSSSIPDGTDDEQMDSGSISDVIRNWDNEGPDQSQTSFAKWNPTKCPNLCRLQWMASCWNVLS